MSKIPFFLLIMIPLLAFSAKPSPVVKVSNMSLEEKVGQMLLTHFNGIEVTEEANKLINECFIGGIIYYQFSNPFDSPQQVQSLSINLQKQAKSTKLGIPLLICADQEGGLVNRLENGFTIFPSAKAIANAGDLELAKKCASSLALELKTVGINMNLSPVVDINSKQNPVIGIRSFGNKTSIVIDYAKAFLRGYRNSRLISCMKHFPGHGSVQIDSHESLPICPKTKDELERCDLQPYKALHLKSDCIMTAHVLYPELDAKSCATLSKPILHNLLRRQLGFKGVVISDSLVMDGILENVPTIEEAAVEAVKAGCDILCLGGKQLFGERKDFELTADDDVKIHKHLCQAVLDGSITESRINTSVNRILKLKKAYHLFTESYPKKEALKSFVGTNKNEHLAKKIAALSIKAFSKKTNPLSFGSFVVVAPTFTSKAVLASNLINQCKSLIFYDNINPSDEEIQQIKNQLPENSNILFLSFKAWKYEKQKSLLKELNSPSNIIVTSLADSLDESTLKDFCNILITTDNPTPTALNAVCDHIHTISTQEISK